MSIVRRPGGVFGAVWLVFVVVASLTAPLWRPYDVDAQDLAARLALPSGEHWLGTDPLGRDVLSRIFSAGVLPLLSSALMLVVAFGIGLPLALVAAERGRFVERVISRLTEILMALPLIVLLLAVIGAIGNRIYPVMAILGVLLSASVYRVLLGVAQSVRQRLYVDAARVNGLGSLRVNLLHVVPSMATVVAVQAAQLFGIGLLINAGLAFLGFGPSEPQPSWGFMIQDASKHIFDDPWLMVPTGTVLALTVVAANELADALAGAGARERQRRKPRAAHAALTAPAAPAAPTAPTAPAAPAAPTAPTASTAPTAPAVGPQGAATAADPAAADSADFAAASTVPAPRGGGSGGGAGSVLEVRGLSVGVEGGPELVSGVSFSVRAGRVLGLVGESGCGKTMTARSLLGLLPDGVSVTGGAIRWKGQELSDFRAVRGREIALISQEPMVALDPMFTIAYQLTQPIRRFRDVGRREARRTATELLQQVGIVDADRVLTSYPHQLSGGMAQRVCIALALTGEPELLVADEPTTALDVTVQAEILSLLRKLVRDRGLAVVLVSHDLGVVADLCDDVAVMYAGQVMESGTAAAVLDDPAHPYTMALLGANPHVPEGESVPERLASIPGSVPPPGSWPTGCRFAARCRFAREHCTTPFAVKPAHATGTALCVRIEELSRTRATWDAEEVGAETAGAHQ
ncbi:dipeptide/oligopeptide/nickel ABC transporter permease/ATP-binding protein [Cryptosporangium sp. NPDC048952]|uniref:dipeptide/oligopeptide/nickel ABC transporter permease/ATP-binding protein n=1 Tax=Cryptosporangium sp. NPDC048952 TaxID=3363961 RepID=UPI003720AA84